jgi:hypothetical protein
MGVERRLGSNPEIPDFCLLALLLLWGSRWHASANGHR